MGEPTLEDSVVNIPTKGLTWVDQSRLVIFGLFTIAVFFLLWFDFDHRGPAVLSLAEGLGLGFMVTTAAALTSFSSVRRVTIDRAGITFSLPFHKNRVSWSDLIPSRAPLSHQLWGVLRKSQKNAHRGRPYLLTLEQSRAILAYPFRPPWNIPERVARSLGVNPETVPAGSP
jgi:hypothetical protein